MSLTIDRSNEFIFKVFRIPKDSAQYFHDKGLWWLLTKIIFLKSFDTIFHLEEYVKLKGQGHSKQFKKLFLLKFTLGVHLRFEVQ